MRHQSRVSQHPPSLFHTHKLPLAARRTTRVFRNTAPLI
jgi:hypothetical protein